MSQPASASTDGLHPLRRLLVDAVPNVVVFGLLAFVFLVGHHTGWKLPHSWNLSTAAAPDDWCPEHLVPESACIECNDKLLPKPHEFGYCRQHGVAECVIDHPELAQVDGKPRLPQYDTAQAIVLMARPENDAHDTLHLRRVQLASEETAIKAGINVDVVRERPMTDAVAPTAK